MDQNPPLRPVRPRLTTELQKATVRLGNILTIGDKIQSFSEARKTGEIYFPNVPPPARIIMEKGEIVDARLGLLSGLEAAVGLINMQGDYLQTEFILGDLGHRRTITLPIAQILIEARKQQELMKKVPVPGPRASLEVPSIRVPDGSQFKLYVLRPGITYLGRSLINDIIIPDGTISQLHASVEYSPQGIFLKDLKSSNGTFVGGEEISERWLVRDEYVQFGAIECIFNGPIK